MRGNPASAEDCTVSATAGPPASHGLKWIYTVHVAKNPCGRPLRAAEYDYFTTGVPTGPFPDGPGNFYGWVYGSVVTTTGAQSVCDPGWSAVNVHTWGYQEQINGKWTWHFVGGDNKVQP
jgi:hypothetical protein